MRQWFKKLRTNKNSISNVKTDEQSCLPRLIYKGGSYWFNAPQPEAIFFDERSQYSLVVYQKGEIYYLTQMYVEKKKKVATELFDGNVLLNGHSIYEKQRLKDGDFILFGTIPAIFQIDPVADRLTYITATYEAKKLISLPKYLNRRITVDDSGIAFHKLHTHVKWCEIDAILVTQISYRVKLTVLTSARKTNVNVLLNVKDLSTLLERVMLYSPIDLSVFNLNNEPIALQDGYLSVAQYKILDPMETGKRPRIASRETILGIQEESSSHQFKQHRTLWIGLVIIMSVIALTNFKWFVGIVFLIGLQWVLTRLFPFSN